MAKETVVIGVRLPVSVARKLAKLATLAHLNRATYLRVKLEEIAQRESLDATSGQS
jgi:hypothetical protein